MENTSQYTMTRGHMSDHEMAKINRPLDQYGVQNEDI